MEKENTTKEESGRIPCANSRVCILMFTLYSPAGGTSDTPESTQGLTLSLISGPPKWSGSLPHSYWQLTSLGSRSLYFLQSLPLVLVFHQKGHSLFYIPADHNHLLI